MNGLDARKQDVGPIDPPEPKLTENEVEAAVEERLIDLFNSGERKATEVLRGWVANNPDTCANALLWAAVDGETEPSDDIVSATRAAFIESAKNAPEWDHIRREVEES